MGKLVFVQKFMKIAFLPAAVPQIYKSEIFVKILKRFSKIS